MGGVSQGHLPTSCTRNPPNFEEEEKRDGGETKPPFPGAGATQTLAALRMACGGHPALPAGGWRCLRTHLGRAQGRTRHRQPPHPLLTRQGELPPGCYSLCRFSHIIRDGDGLVACPPARRRPAQQLLLLRRLSLRGWALAGQPPGRRLGKGSGHLSAPPRTSAPEKIMPPT